MLELTNSWIEEGRQAGRQDGARATLLAVLEARFGMLDESLSSRLASVVDPLQLSRLAARAVTADTLEDFLSELESL